LNDFYWFFKSAAGFSKFCRQTQKDFMNQLLKSISGLALLACTYNTQAQYNTLWIPDTLSGTQFNLSLRDTFAQIVPGGNQTITGGINNKFWGPTLFFNKWDTVHMNVQSYLNDSTTLHWHGMHLPAVMDGGPHQVIPPGTLWQPYWRVTNRAALYWYHPHLHEMTMDQITKGLGGLIIVRDSTEKALSLPRTYGVDDIPLALTDRSFDNSNQFKSVPYGDSMMVNGTLRPQFSIPGQVVRFRILNAAIERSYYLGFSDNRTFYVITTDGGLVNTPVPLTRFLISAGERVEILVNCTGQSGQTVDLKAYNSQLSNFVPGGESFTGGPFANNLGKKDFVILHLNIGAQTSSPITSIPSSLVTNTFLNSSSSVTTRTITLSDSSGVPGIVGPNAFILGHKIFNLNYINYTVPLNNVETWQLQSSSVFAHPFHIHDVQFYILSINGASPPAEQQGWKDVILVKSGETTRFIARFDDYADNSHPFMYHCHIALHEDEGMMGQFVVSNASGIAENTETIGLNLFPNPAQDRLFISFDKPDATVYYITLTNANGKAVMMLPQPQLQNGIDISKLPAGIYFAQVTDLKTHQQITKKFIKQ
jgi:bilirubin oxidase